MDNDQNVTNPQNATDIIVNPFNNPELVATYQKKRMHLLTSMLNTKYIDVDSEMQNYFNAIINAPNYRYTIYSAYNRLVINLQILKYVFVVNKTNVLTSCFKVKSKYGTCIYGYVYSIVIGGKLTHEFVCIGPTYQSQDGEFRSSVMSYNRFIQLFTIFSEETDVVEQMIVDNVNAGKLEFSIEFFVPDKYAKFTRQLSNEMDDKRLALKLYNICWSCDYGDIKNNTCANHMNETYKKTIMMNSDNIANRHLGAEPQEKHKISASDVYDKLMKLTSKYNTGIANIYNYHGSNMNRPSTMHLDLRCCQKIFPMSIIEAIRTEDINFNVWREIYTSALVSNLVINLISPSFPVISNWFYIQNSSERLFDNSAIHMRFSDSNLAHEISENLRDINTLNYIDRKKSKGYINSKFHKLSRAICKGIVYADSDIQLTDLSVCVLMENVGRTLRDLPALIVANDNIHASKEAFTDFNLFSKHLFEYIYALFCANEKCGIMHGDLHMNNVTLYRLYYAEAMQKDCDLWFSKGKSPAVAYYVDNKMYCFKHTGMFSSIIDFSRCIIGNYQRIEREFSTNFADRYFLEQRIRVIHMLYQHFPEVVEKYRDKIEKLLTDKFEMMFKIISALDSYTLCYNIKNMFIENESFAISKAKHIGIDPRTLKLLDSIIAKSSKLVHDGFDNVLSGKYQTPEDVEWANLEIIRSEFANRIYNVDRIKSENLWIVDFYNGKNELVYNIDEPELWGPLINFGPTQEIFKQFFPDFEDYDITRWEKIMRVNESQELQEIYQENSRIEEDVVEFEPWMHV